jgi:hypothetical protein
LVYVHKIAELSRRGDIDAVAELMKGHFSDKENNPWDRIYKDIETYWKRENPKTSASNTILHIRDAFFGALDILSLSIALSVPTSELVTLFIKENSWKDGRRSVRNRCIELIEGLIKKKKTRHLVPSALKRDGFGFLVDDVEKVELKLFKKAKPKLKRVSGKKKEVLDLKPLETLRVGSRFLREQMIMETELEKKDPRIPALQDAYDQFLSNYEVDRRSVVHESVQTEQVTLNGSPLTETSDEVTTSKKRKSDKAVQSPLTDYLETKKDTRKKKSKKTQVKKKRRTKRK